MDLQRALIPYDIHYQYVMGNQRSVFHSYVDWGSELVIILNGTGVFRVDNRIFPVARGHIFLLTGDYVKEIYDADKLNICSVFFHEEHLVRSAALFRHMVGYQKFFIENPVLQKTQEQDCLCMEEVQFKEIELLLSHMSLEWQGEDIGSVQMLNSMFFILITAIARAYSRDVTKLFDPQSTIRQMAIYIRCHYAEELTLADLASVAYLSPRHFDRKFKEVYQVSPMQYIRNLRLAHAGLLLEQSDLTVAQISEECGFSDLNYFIRIFRNEFHMNPSNYRKTKLEAESDVKSINLRPC